MRKVAWWVIAMVVAFGFVGRSYAQISASATISAQQTGLDSWNYSMSLTNTGSTPIGTYWFSWIPGYDFLPSAPTAMSAPTGWTVSAPQDGIIQPYWSIQWVTSSASLQPGHTLSGFNFTSPDAPDTVAGPSYFGFPITESYVYMGAPEADPGFVFNAPVSTPEPATLSICLAPAAVMLVRRRRRASQRLIDRHHV